MLGPSSATNRRVDWELLVPVGFILLASLGALRRVCRDSQPSIQTGVPPVSVALAACAVQYFLFFTLAGLGSYLLSPTILVFSRAWLF
jgi:hypothetical protein